MAGNFKFQQIENNNLVDCMSYVDPQFQDESAEL